jgi:tetratricopeptide (TPR) repeat protein
MVYFFHRFTIASKFVPYKSVYESALNKYDEAIFLFDSIGAKVGKAKAETNKGVVLVQLKREQEAKHLYSLALEEFKKSNNKTGQGSVLTKIGELHLQLNEYDKAIATLTEALILRQSLKDRYGEAQNLLLLGKANFVVGNKKTALEQYEESFFINREINYKKGQIRSLYEIAYLHKNQGNIDESLKTIQACINLIESARSDIAVQDLRLSYLASKQECYELCIDVLVTLHEKFPTQDYAKQALIFSERFRARNFLELLTKSTDENNIAYKSLVENVGKYDELLSDKIEQILKIKGISKEEHKLAALQDEIVKIKSDRGIVELEIKKQYPQHYNLERTKFLTFDQIKAAVTDEETLFVEYFLGKETSFCWVVGKDSFQVFRLPSEKIIDPLLDKVIESLKARGEYEKFEFKDEREKRIEALDK